MKNFESRIKNSEFFIRNSKFLIPVATVWSAATPHSKSALAYLHVCN